MKWSPSRPDDAAFNSNYEQETASESPIEAVRQIRARVEIEENYRVIEAWVSPRLLSYFRAYRFSHEDAEDLVQKTLVRVYKGIGQLEQEKKFISWLFAIARNVRLTEIERQLREKQFLVDDLDPESAKELPDPKPANLFYERRHEEERLKQLWAAIEKLPSRQRQCLLLWVRDDMTYEEIAETLQLSVNTVRNHLAESRKSLQKALKREAIGS